MNRKALSALVVASTVTLALFVALSAPSKAEAAALTGLSDTMSNQTASTTSSHVIRFTTPTGAPVNNTIVVTFPAGFSFTSKTIGSLSLTYGASTGAENSTTLAASPTGTNWGAVFSGGSNVILTLTAPSSSNFIPAGNKVILTYDSTNSNNPASATNYVLTIGGGTFADSGSITIPIITNSQVAVSATVAQSLTFSLGSNTINLGSLTTGAVASSSHTMTLASNGISGATVTVAGATLTSTASSTAVITACATGCTSTPGSKQFGINFVNNTSPAVGSNPSGSAPIGTAGTNYNTGNTFRFVSGETVATASQPINTTTYTASYIANIDALMPAGTYTTALTYNATANF